MVELADERSLRFRIITWRKESYLPEPSAMDHYEENKVSIVKHDLEFTCYSY